MKEQKIHISKRIKTRKYYKMHIIIQYYDRGKTEHVSCIHKCEWV